MKLKMQYANKSLRKNFKFKSNKNIDDILLNMCENIKKRSKKFIYNYNIEIENELTPDTWKKN